MKPTARPRHPRKSLRPYGAMTRAWSMCASAIIRGDVIRPDIRDQRPRTFAQWFHEQIEMTSYIPFLKNWDACLRRELIGKMRVRWLGR
jgi:hypothetical protein